MKKWQLIPGLMLLFAALLGGCDLLTGAATPASPAPPPPGGGAPAGSGGSADPAATPAPGEPTPAPHASLFFHEGWARLPASITIFGGYGADQINDVAAGGPGVVAGGYAARNSELDAAIWYSADGLAWERYEDASVLGGQGTQVIEAVAAGARGVAAAGWEQTSSADAAVWYSGDGVTWSRVRSDSLGGEGDQSILDIAALDNGFVAVGREETATEIRGAVWTSRNGVTWERIPHSESVFGGAGVFVELRSVAVVGSALLAAGRVEPLEGGDVDTSIWSSNDGGQTWVRITNSDQTLGDGDSTRYQSVTGVIFSGDLFVMVGTEKNPADSPSGSYVNAVVWSAQDGINWARVFDHKPDFHAQNMLAIAASDFGFWAVGYDTLGEESQAAVWKSHDGITWEQVQHSESIFGGRGLQVMTSIAAAGPGLVAVGYTYENGDQEAAVWVYVPGR
jgi:hypothetical protein